MRAKGLQKMQERHLQLWRSAGQPAPHAKMAPPASEANRCMYEMWAEPQPLRSGLQPTHAPGC